jgi:hypothetical protein
MMGRAVESSLARCTIIEWKLLGIYEKSFRKEPEYIAVTIHLRGARVHEVVQATRQS